MNTLNTPTWPCKGRWTLVTAMVCLLTACASEPSSIEPLFGSAVRNAIVSQTMAPDAGRPTAVHPSADGVMAKAAMDRYRASFEVPPPPVNVMNIGLGGVIPGASR